MYGHSECLITDCMTLTGGMMSTGKDSHLFLMKPQKGISSYRSRYGQPLTITGKTGMQTLSIRKTISITAHGVQSCLKWLKTIPYIRKTIFSALFPHRWPWHRSSGTSNGSWTRSFPIRFSMIMSYTAWTMKHRSLRTGQNTGPAIFTRRPALKVKRFTPPRCGTHGTLTIRSMQRPSTTRRYSLTSIFHRTTTSRLTHIGRTDSQR